MNASVSTSPFEPRHAGSKLPVHLSRPFLAIAYRCESVGSDAMGDEILDDRLGAPLRQPFVVSRRAHIVGVGSQFDGDVRVVVENADELVERCLRTVAQGRLVEIVEDIIDEHRSRDIGKGELQGRVARCFRCLQRRDLLFVIEITLAGGRKR